MRRNHTAVMGMVTPDTTAAAENLYQSPGLEVAAVSAIATVCPVGRSSGERPAPKPLTRTSAPSRAPAQASQPRDVDLTLTVRGADD